jgi:hypothetical protein
MRAGRDRALLAQGGYYLATGVAPFVSRRMFEAVTGPKREWWLVQTVGGLVSAVGATLATSALRKEPAPTEVVGLAVGCAATLMIIDVYYVARGRIAPSYLADAAVEAALVAAVAGPRLAEALAGRGQRPQWFEWREN